MKLMTRILPIILMIGLLPAAYAQSAADTAAMQTLIDEAQRALVTAENVGAPVYAKELYEEALARMNMAKISMSDDKRSVREGARLRAIEAKYAARAAEARARWMVNTTEARNLRDDIGRFGGTVPALSNIEDVPDTVRGATSLDRVNHAKAWVDRAKAAGGQLVAPDDLKSAEAWLKSAERIAKSDKQNDSADHLAYISEMMARRAYYLALRSDIDRVLPGLRLERTRLVQVETERQAALERERRQQTEQEAEQLRDQLAQAEMSRQSQARELDALRSQLNEREQALQGQLQADRQARLEAEQRLFDLVSKYEAAIATQNQAEVDRLRREVEDQRFQLESFQERQRLSETTMSSETDRLVEELERERASGRASEQMLADRAAELTRRQQELEQVRQEREASVRRAQETEDRMNELSRRAAEAEQESQRLRAQVQESQERAAAAQNQAQQLQAELERVRADRDRLERMQAAVGTGAVVRSESRGLVVTLPGIYFDSGKATLKTGAKNTLAKIAGQLSGNNAVKIIVEGHTDNVGSEASNETLSQRRADAVRDYLSSQGVSSSLISASGRGEGAPIATNDTPAGRQQNRRVEIIISQ